MNPQHKKIAEIIFSVRSLNPILWKDCCDVMAIRTADYFEEKYWRKEVIEKSYSIFKGTKRLTQEAHQKLKEKRNQFLKTAGAKK